MRRAATRNTLIIAAALLVTACGASRSATKTTVPAIPSTVRSTPAPAVTTTTATSSSAPTTTAPTTPPASSTTVAPPRTPTPAAPPTTATSGSAVVIAKGPPSRKVVALTFDAGSDAGHTAGILDILAAHRVPATFGITGVWAQANPALLGRIAAAGDQIVNHSWDHQSFTGASTSTAPLTATQIGQELGRTEDVIRQLAGASTKGWFRPPYGDRDGRVDAVAGAAGYRYELMWSVDTLGWKGVPPATVLQRCLAAATPGEIILMHVGSASTDAAALPAVIAALQARGYGFVIASALV